MYVYRSLRVKVLYRVSVSLLSKLASYLISKIKKEVIANSTDRITSLIVKLIFFFKLKTLPQILCLSKVKRAKGSGGREKKIKAIIIMTYHLQQKTLYIYIQFVSMVYFSFSFF